MVQTLVSILIGLIIAVPLGNVIGGYAGDVVIEAAYEVFENCKTNPSDYWEEYCNQIKENFDDTIKKSESTKALYQFIGIFIPVGIAAVALWKKFNE